MKTVLIFVILLLLGSSCGMNRSSEPKSDSALKVEYLEKGKAIVQVAQPELLKNVSRAMGEGGPVHAIDFCHLRALDIKDSLSSVYDCEIRRIALKYRNPEDRPQTGLDTEVLDQYLSSHTKGEDLAPQVHVFDKKVEYYQPIVLANGACLLCHGKAGEQISDETMVTIRDLYPEDQATGFEMNDFRGAWKITFQR